MLTIVKVHTYIEIVERSGKMDKVYIDNNQRAEVIELPKYGEVKLIVKDGKVVQYLTMESHKMTGKTVAK